MANSAKVSSARPQERRILIIEPYYGGSHRSFIETLLPLSIDYDSVLAETISSSSHNDKNQNYPQQNGASSLASTLSSTSKSTTSKFSKWPKFKFTLVEMSPKKWHWRSRTSALYLSRTITNEADLKFDILFASSILNLAELIALRPDIGRISIKIIYFHENQLAYPIQHHKERDFQFGYNQILSCLVADQIVFNSKYNRSSFLNNIKPFLKMMPDYRPPNIDHMIDQIEKKCRLLYYPIIFSNVPLMHAQRRQKSILHIIWPHRWEHDKNPEEFFNLLFKLKDEHKIPFKISVLGESFSEIPKIFVEAKTRLSNEIVHWGFVESKQDYYEVMASGNVCISTAIHEFFGVSMLEAAYCGCYPLCPSRLVYPEIFPGHYLYKSEDELLNKLIEFGKKPDTIPLPLDIAFDVFDWIYCQDEYRTLFSQFVSETESSTTATISSNKPEQKQSKKGKTKSTVSSLTSKLSSFVNHHK